MKKIAFLCFLPLYVVVASVWVNPAHFRLAGPLGLAFPAALALAVAVLFVVLLFRPKKAWLALLAFAPAALSMRAYMPVNIPSPQPRGALKVMTYNTHCYGDALKDSTDGFYFLCKDIRSEAPDLFCLQEARGINKEMDDAVASYFKSHGRYYFLQHPLGASALAVGSKYPILSSETVCRHEQNGAAAFRIKLPKGDTLLIVNCHLESMQLSLSERADYSDLVHHTGETSLADSTYLTMARKIVNASRERALQVDTIVRFLERNKHTARIVVCGDLNDTPVSYAHHALARHLTDAYAASGNGFGRSFARDAIFVRIDHLFCSSAFRPYAARVETALTRSDHYPLIAYLMEVKK